MYACVYVPMLFYIPHILPRVKLMSQELPNYQGVALVCIAPENIYIKSFQMALNVPFNGGSLQLTGRTHAKIH